MILTGGLLSYAQLLNMHVGDGQLLTIPICGHLVGDLLFDTFSGYLDK